LGVAIRLTGHVTMPYLSFPGEDGYRLRDLFARECAAHGVYLHPRHNWFISAALTKGDMHLIADATGSALAAVAAAAHK
jgi:glutamate-1-semialdehyde 2,1-aminomutase